MSRPFIDNAILKPSKMKLVYIFGLMEMHLTELEACVIFQSLKDMRKTSENVFGLGKISEKIFFLFGQYLS